MLKLTDWENALADKEADEGLRILSEEMGTHARFSSSLGMEDQVITHLIATQKLSIQIFTIDTGRLFQEAYDLLELTTLHYQQKVKVYFPDHNQVEKLLHAKGPNSFYHSVENRKECCHIRKVEPLKRALEGAKVWITGIRKEQSSNRQLMSPVEWDDQHQVIKYHPLFFWTQHQVENFIEEKNIPVNTLHKKGYPSIGCAPCTRAVDKNADPRSGRWWWEGDAKECGLHSVKTVTSTEPK
jgi:phosphoadenosine phosphosulfate reductase